MLSSKHFERSERFKQTGSNEFAHLPSLVVCPPTLTGHWSHEIRQYATNLRPLLYTGHPTERARLLSKISEYDCVVASYDTVRNDVDALSKFDWLYCILDEGHVIKSAKTKTTKAVKMIKAQHRLILSGTPIQNNVLELWSLFDFLMPGFLGTEKQFMERYGRPILASRDAKVSAREHERAALALDALHKQVLPFVLRRMKEDVLDDLPPKIIQDISCEMSDVQRQLFDDYMRTQNRDELNDDALQDGTPDQQQHVFQTLQYLRRLVCHPLMVFDPQKPRHRQIEQALKQSSGKTIADIANAPKLLALKQLLLDCGIGTQGAAGDVADAGISQHRVLIFCQQRRMLDIIERDLFRGNMPDVTFARLDGSITAPEKRYEIVQRFNADPSIDVLLLTTSVGGLGLTLTGADTVIFVEHDWNPMKDMQAMDRAHRLGQKKVVNVYRLITKDTLEEQIMGLQRFKLNVAGNIVNQQNKDTDSMQTDQILDLFDVGAGVNENGEQKADPTKKSKGISQKALLASIEGMGDTGDDYEGMAQWSATDG
jgi:TATA-binding protein-associated factor